MTAFQVAALLITLAAIFSYVNHRWLRLPTTIGLMLISLVFSLGIVAAGTRVPEVRAQAAAFLERAAFDQTLLQGMLGFLLFAGALHIDLDALSAHQLPITVLATIGVLISTAVIGVLGFLASGYLGLGLRLIDCLVFGALISPTDPIAVLGVLKRLGAPKDLEIQIGGESLFNDGVGVVVFLALTGIASGAGAGGGHIALLFVTEAIGGALFGLAIGWVGYRMCKSIDQYQVEVLISLAVVAGGYALANAIHTSGPIAMVCAGLLLGNQGRRFAMSDTTREHLDDFWELVDEVLNAVLFVLIGLEVLAITYSSRWMVAGAVAIPILLCARWISVALPIGILRRSRPFRRGTIRILTWGGLRGGISVALALSLPPGPVRDGLLVMTYVCVVFSIIVQGTTVQKVFVRLVGPAA
jgi:CPA1 family monovalent cation:H+ antiporter